MDGAHAEHQPFSYLGVGEPGRDQPQHLDLARREPGGMAGRPWTRQPDDSGNTRRSPSCPLGGEPLLPQGAARAVGAAREVSVYEGRPRCARPLTEAFGRREQPRRRCGPVRVRQSLEASRLEHRVAELARDLEPLLEPRAGGGARAPAGCDVAQATDPAQHPPAIADLPELCQRFVEERLGTVQVTVGESYPAETLRGASGEIASAEPTRCGPALLQTGACVRVVTLHPQHAPQRLERAADARLVIEPPV